MIKIILVSLVFAVIIIFLKNIKSDLAILVEIISGIIVLTLAVEYLYDTFSFFTELINLTGLDSEVFTIILKITAVAYLIEFGAGTVEDFGLKNLSNKLVFVGKFVILGISMPVVYSVFNLFKNLLL